jgi:hypothetical protein
VVQSEILALLAARVAFGSDTFKKADDFFDAPDVIRQTRFHGGRGSERFVVANRVQLTTDGLKVYINAISCFYK